MIQLKRHLFLPELKAKWKELENDQIPPFMHYDFAYTMWKDYLLYCIHGKFYPVFYEVIIDGETVLIAPLVKKFFRNEYISYGDENGSGNTGFVFNCASAITEKAMKELTSKLGTIKIKRVKDNTLFAQLCQKFNSYQVTRTVPCAEIKFNSTLSEWYSQLGKSQKQNIRTAYNRLSRDSKIVSIEVVQGNNLSKYNCQPYFDINPVAKVTNIKFTSAQKTKIFDTLLDLYFERHEKKYGLKTHPIKRWYLKHLNFCTRALYENENALSIICRIDGIPAAFLSGIANNGGSTLYVPRLAINDSYNQYSPGVILLTESIRFLLDYTTIRDLDLLQGDEPYKMKMGGQRYLNLSFNL